MFDNQFILSEGNDVPNYSLRYLNDIHRQIIPKTHERQQKRWDSLSTLVLDCTYKSIKIATESSYNPGTKPAVLVKSGKSSANKARKLAESCGSPFWEKSPILEASGRGAALRGWTMRRASRSRERRACVRGGGAPRTKYIYSERNPVSSFDW